MRTDVAEVPGSARVSRTFRSTPLVPKRDLIERLFRRDAETNTRDACATQSHMLAIIPGSAGCQPAASGSLPNASVFNSPPIVNSGWRQAAANYRLAACGPQT